MGMQEQFKIRTLVVEDEEKIAAGICHKIQSVDVMFEIVGCASNGKEALDKIAELKPHVVFTDIAMPVMDGMELAKEIKNSSPDIIIVIISGYSNFGYAQKAIRYGVFNYLLKPLEEEALQETLFDIKKSLSHFTVHRQRHVIYSPEYRIVPEQGECFLLIELCMGNVIYNLQDEEVWRFYEEQAGAVPWKVIMTELCEEEQEWFVADEHAPNQKMIAIKAKQSDDVAMEEHMKALTALIQEYTELPVTMCGVRHAVLQKDVWDGSKQLRNVIKQRLVIGRNNIFFPDEDGTFRHDLLEIVKMKMNTYIRQYFISTNLENFMNEIQTVFEYMESKHASQESIEKLCLYVLKLLEFSSQEYGQNFLDEMQMRMIRSISISVSEKELFENLMREFRKVNHFMESIYEDKIENRLLDYVSENYLTIESVEQIADEFGYNYAYLSRLFKKKAGVSMNRYITEKKIGLAKQLLKENPNMNLTKISDLCGYNDYRYFSRVFRAETGMTPGEYRE
ncbi:response regulator [Lachnospiraceae bacterium ASD3451]|uniref:response regulator n=1 Tax=Diplocloster agilis TaxID=2850323 RepID=UPI001DEE2D85|nr:response regulator [Diplocloster agilis]MBU9743920.1 response regulator [Diplocloster agilis]